MVANVVAVVLDQLAIGWALRGVFDGRPDENLTIVAELLGIDLDGIAFDHARVLQPVDPRGDGGGGQVNALGEMAHLEPTIMGEGFENLEIRLVEQRPTPSFLNILR